MIDVYVQMMWHRSAWRRGVSGNFYGSRSDFPVRTFHRPMLKNASITSSLAWASVPPPLMLTPVWMLRDGRAWGGSVFEGFKELGRRGGHASAARRKELQNRPADV